MYKRPLQINFICLFSAEMILERLNLPDLLEEEKKNMEELAKLKISQRVNPSEQKTSPCTRSEVNRTTGIIVERTVENIGPASHVGLDSAGDKVNDLVLEIRATQQVPAAEKNPGKTQGTENESRPHMKISDTVSKKTAGSNQMNKSLNIHDVSLTDMLNSSNEDEESVNVSSIIGSLRVGQTFSNATSESSLIGSNIQKKNLKSDLPSRTSTPIRSHQDKNNIADTDSRTIHVRGLFSSAKAENEEQATDQISIEKSAIRKTIENRLTQVSHRNNLTDLSKNSAESGKDLLTSIEGEHKLVCLTDKQAKKSKEYKGKKLSSKLKNKLNSIAAGNKQQENSISADKDDFGEENPTVIRKRKRIAVIEDDDDTDNELDSVKDKKNAGSAKTDGDTPVSLKDKSDSSKSPKKVKQTKISVKDSAQVKHVAKDANDKVSGVGTKASEPRSKVSKSTLSELEKFAFDDSRSDRSSSGESFMSNTSLTTSMMSGSLWLTDKTGAKTTEMSKSEVVNNSIDFVNVENNNSKATASISEMASNLPESVNENTFLKDKITSKNSCHISGNNIVSSLVPTSSNIGNSRDKSDLLQNLNIFNRKKETTNNTENVKNVSNINGPHSVLKTKENKSVLNNTTRFTGNSPSWLAALKSKKPSPVFSISEPDDLDLDLDDLEFSDNPLKRPKFS